MTPAPNFVIRHTGKIGGARNAMSAPLFAMTRHLLGWAVVLADTFWEA